jgi:hypothetical protein
MPLTLPSPQSLLASSRRAFLGDAGKATLSATAVALIAGCESMAQTSMTQGGMTQGGMSQSGNSMADVNILNVALGLEHEAIMAYQLGAESGLLMKPALDVAVLFQSHHKSHAEALAGTIRKLGGKPVDAKSKAEYAQALNAAGLKSGTDVLKLAARLERGATNAYLGVIPSFNDKALAQVAARLAADEAMHWTALSGALAEALPAQALSFGA